MNISKDMAMKEKRSDQWRSEYRYGHDGEKISREGARSEREKISREVVTEE